MIVFACPTCRNTMQVPPAMAGYPVTCPFCHRPVVVPPFGIAPPPPEPLVLEDPVDDAERDRRTLAQREERDQKQKRNARITIALGLLGALIGAGFLVALGPRLVADARGAKPVTEAELLALTEADVKATPWVAYNAERVVETDLGLHEPKGKYTNEQTRFVMVPVQDRWLIAERPFEENGNRLEGKLEVWDDGPTKEAAGRIKARYPDLKDKFLPVQLSASRGSISSNATVQLIALGAFVVIGVCCAVSGVFSLPRKQQ